MEMLVWEAKRLNFSSGRKAHTLDRGMTAETYQISETRFEEVHELEKFLPNVCGEI
jgi:hypothetical protein